MPKSRNNPDRRPMGRRSAAYWRTGRELGQKRSTTRAKQRMGLKARIAKALRDFPGACFINGKWQLPYKYGYVSSPSGQFRFRVRFLKDHRATVLATGLTVQLNSGDDTIVTFLKS